MTRGMKWLGVSLLQLAILVPVATMAMGSFAAEDAVRAKGPRDLVPPVCPCVARVRCRSVETRSPDGTTLKAWYYEPDNPNGGTILMLHGLGGNRTDVVALGTVFERAGYSVLAPDLRGHGEVGGLVTYGVNEAQDVRAWADWLLQQPRADRLYGFGASLGASVLLASLKTETRFRAVIAESPFSDFPSIARERTARSLPAPVRDLTGLFVEGGRQWIRFRYGIDLARASAIDGIRNTRTPVLLAHGLADHRTSPDNSRVLAAANPAVARLWLMPGAGHANLWATSRAEFEARVLAFLAQPSSGK